MNKLPFYVVTLNHASWADALRCARNLPKQAMPELRIDLFPHKDPGEMVRALDHKCLLTCRREIDGGGWNRDEASRLKHLLAGLKSSPAWMDLEYDLEIPVVFTDYMANTKLLRSTHALDGTFDLQQRIVNVPKGDAFKWVGSAAKLVDNMRVREVLSSIYGSNLLVSAFLKGPKGILSRCMQAAWGGSFTYVCPDNTGPAAPGQMSLSSMLKWNCHRISLSYGLCSVIGDPVMHSLSPNYHNASFQKKAKELFYVPLHCSDPEEAKVAIESLDILGLSITSPLKETLPPYFGLCGPLNTIWRKAVGQKWQGTNTDFFALDSVLNDLPPGPVLLLGDGGVSKTTQKVLSMRKWPYLVLSRRVPISTELVHNLKPIGIIQATCLGMNANDQIPFLATLERVKSHIRWGIEWIYKEETAFSKWLQRNGCKLIFGKTLFDIQASRQSEIFLSIGRGPVKERERY